MYLTATVGCCLLGGAWEIESASIVNATGGRRGQLRSRDGLVGYDDCLTRSRSRVRFSVLVQALFLM